MTRSKDQGVLDDVNVSELLKLAEEQGLGILSAACARHRLQSIVTGVAEPQPEDLCPTNKNRVQLSEFVEKHKNILHNQLPVCKGACMTFGCPMGVALNCYDENREHLD